MRRLSKYQTLAGALTSAVMSTPKNSVVKQVLWPGEEFVDRMNV